MKDVGFNHDVFMKSPHDSEGLALRSKKEGSLSQEQSETIEAGKINSEALAEKLINQLQAKE